MLTFAGVERISIPEQKAFMHAGQAAYLVTFGRSGEDNKSFKLGDVDQTLAGSSRAFLGLLPSKRQCWLGQIASCALRYVGFAGADYDLQDALVESTDKKTTTRDADGQQFYDYELIGPVRHPMSLYWHAPVIRFKCAVWEAKIISSRALCCRPTTTLPQ